ncbi:MAG: helix-turn-helix domain-containing protein [Oscillospiraceae bacterium]|jgi:ribosome-binding protein aMBF1 (putative translation factor)
MKPIQYYGNRNIVGGRIKQARKARGWSQGDLAAKMQVMNINMDQKVISKIERNQRLVTDYEVICFSRALGVSNDWLLGECEE